MHYSKNMEIRAMIFKLCYIGARRVKEYASEIRACYNFAPTMIHCLLKIVRRVARYNLTKRNEPGIVWLAEVMIAGSYVK